MAIYQTAAFRVKPGSLDTCINAIETFVSHVNAQEPGTLLYTSLQATDDPTRFLHWMIFADEDALEIHRASDAVRTFTDALYPQLASEGVAFTRYTARAGDLKG